MKLKEAINELLAQKYPQIKMIKISTPESVYAIRVEEDNVKIEDYDKVPKAVLHSRIAGAPTSEVNWFSGKATIYFQVPEVFVEMSDKDTVKNSLLRSSTFTSI